MCGNQDVLTVPLRSLVHDHGGRRSAALPAPECGRPGTRGRLGSSVVCL